MVGVLNFYHTCCDIHEQVVISYIEKFAEPVFVFESLIIVVSNVERSYLLLIVKVNNR